MSARSIKREVALRLVSQFPHSSNSGLARLAVRDHAPVFNGPEDARYHIRVVRGAAGDDARKRTADKALYGTTPDPFAAIPAGKKEFDGWAAKEFTGPMRVLILPDVHCPYHSDEALKIALRYGLDHGADTVLLNGDFMDCYSVSRWETDPRERDLALEIKTARALLHVIRDAFPSGRIIYKEGNHEERLYLYLVRHAAELLGVKEVELASLLKLSDFGVEQVGEKRPMRFGALNAIHGHEYPFAISNPVNPARGFFLRTKVLCVGSHFHQTSQHSEKDLEEKVVSTWSTGCLCDLHPRYRPLNNWNHGFAFEEVHEDGSFVLSNLRIIDGKVY